MVWELEFKEPKSQTKLYQILSEAALATNSDLQLRLGSVREFKSLGKFKKGYYSNPGGTFYCKEYGISLDFVAETNDSYKDNGFPEFVKICFKSKVDNSAALTCTKKLLDLIFVAQSK